MPAVKELHGYRVVGYWECPTSRVVVVAVHRPFDYAVYVLWTNAEREVGDDTITTDLWPIKTSGELSRTFLALVLVLS